jgi:hypothetical protein
MFIELHFNICDMFKIILIILALIAMVGTTTHYAFANNMGGPAMGPADTGGGGGGGSMGSSDTTTSPSGPDTTQSNTYRIPADWPAGWLAGHEQYGGPGGYGLWRHEHHHLWGSDFWRDQRLRYQDYYWNKYMDEHVRHSEHPGP